MKKFFFFLLALFAVGTGSQAQIISVADDVEALSLGETVSFNLHMTGVTAMTSIHFEVTVSAGFSVTAVSATSDWTAMFSHEEGVVSAISTSDNALTGDGDIATIQIEVPEGTTVGAYPVTVDKVRVNGMELVTTAMFYVNVVNNHTVVLDEASTTAPEAATGVDVRVKRTIRADEWSTICLPFAMTEAQVKSAFGDEAQLADFTSYEVTEDDDENIVGIVVNFDDVDISEGLEANHPYIIKVATDVSEFAVDGVDIVPDEDNAYIESNNGKSGNRKVVYHGFYGTYRAETEIPEFYLFLNSNKFYYSKGLTKTKAYRAYFYFNDVLTSVEEAGAKVRFFIDDTAAEIEGIGGVMQTGAVYSVSGVRMGTADRLKTLPKGLYIVNGKKVYNQ